MPDCETEAGCKIPPLSDRGARALEIRDKLIRLSRLGIGGRIMDLYQVDLDDLELLAVIEDRNNEQPQGAPDEGH